MNVTVKAQVEIDADPGIVWTYTQDWSRRHEWDPTVKHAEVIRESPRVVRVTASGGFTGLATYKLEDPPHRTSLAFVEVQATWPVTGGGGAWRYDSIADGRTLFQVTNTLVIKGGICGRMVRPLVRWQLNRGTRTALRAAKQNIERRRERPSDTP